MASKEKKLVYYILVWPGKHYLLTPVIYFFDIFILASTLGFCCNVSQKKNFKPNFFQAFI